MGATVDADCEVPASLVAGFEKAAEQVDRRVVDGLEASVLERS